MMENNCIVTKHFSQEDKKMYIVLCLIMLCAGLLLFAFPQKIFRCVKMAVSSKKMIGCRLLGFLLLLCGGMAIYAVISGVIVLPLMK